MSRSILIKMEDDCAKLVESFKNLYRKDISYETTLIDLPFPGRGYRKIHDDEIIMEFRYFSHHKTKIYVYPKYKKCL